MWGKKARTRRGEAARKLSGRKKGEAARPKLGEKRVRMRTCSLKSVTRREPGDGDGRTAGGAALGQPLPTPDSAGASAGKGTPRAEGRLAEEGRPEPGPARKSCPAARCELRGVPANSGGGMGDRGRLVHLGPLALRPEPLGCGAPRSRGPSRGRSSPKLD